MDATSEYDQGSHQPRSGPTVRNKALERGEDSKSREVNT
jgi:hypothetical protein